MAAYATYKLANRGEFNRLAAKGKAWVQGTIPLWKVNPSLADSTMSAEDIFHNVVQNRINPDYGITGLKGKGAENNCMRCTFYSVDKETGQFSDFAYLEDGVFEDVMNLFEKGSLHKEIASES